MGAAIAGAADDDGVGEAAGRVVRHERTAARNGDRRAPGRVGNGEGSMHHRHCDLYRAAPISGCRRRRGRIDEGVGAPGGLQRHVADIGAVAKHARVVAAVILEKDAIAGNGLAVDEFDGIERVIGKMDGDLRRPLVVVLDVDADAQGAGGEHVGHGGAAGERQPHQHGKHGQCHEQAGVRRRFPGQTRLHRHRPSYRVAHGRELWSPYPARSIHLSGGDDHHGTPRMLSASAMPSNRRNDTSLAAPLISVGMLSGAAPTVNPVTLTVDSLSNMQRDTNVSHRAHGSMSIDCNVIISEAAR